MFVAEIYKQINKIAEETPQKIAIYQNEEAFTYRHFKNKVDEITFSFTKLQLNENIGLFLDNTFVGYCAVYAAALNNITYVPLAITDPFLRLKNIIEMAQIKTIVCEDKTHKLIQKDLKKYLIENNIEVIFFNKSNSNNAYSIDIPKKNNLRPLYVLFTSGSTGVPKGVFIVHKSVENFLDWAKKYFLPNGDDIFLAHSRLTFDLSVFNLFLPFMCGSAVRVIDKSVDITYPGEVLKKDITIFLTVPRVTGLMIESEQLKENGFPKLRHVIFCGEKLFASQVNEWLSKMKQLQIHNIYGPTETTVTCTYHRMDANRKNSDPIPIGKCIPNTKIDILNEKNEIIVGEAEGEAIISGVGVSPFNYIGLESDRFFEHPILGRSFKTGDLIYRDKNDCYYWKSRMDYQIKIRGYRVELLEIEAVILQIQEVADVACIFNQEKQKINVFLSLKENLVLDKSLTHKIKTFIESKLPSYMWPEKYEQIVSLPRNNNGKVDRDYLTKLV